MVYALTHSKKLSPMHKREAMADLEYWKKNDALMHRALAKMGLKFRRDKTSWEPEVYFTKSKACYVTCFAADINFVKMPSTPEFLGKIAYFKVFNRRSFYSQWIDNLFIGISSAEELKIKLDLIA